MSKIESIKAREILDSRGSPTVEVDLVTEQGLFRASVPSGVSKGKYEAVELRNGGKRSNGMGVLKAVENVNRVIGPELKGKNPSSQKEIDNLMIELDGTKNKSRLGANAVLAVSTAVCRAGAKAKEIPLYNHIHEISGEQFSAISLPTPCVLLLEGGLHGTGNLDIQEFMIAPKADSFKEKFQIGVKIYQVLGEILKKEYGEEAVKLGIEGAFIPPLKTTKEALELIMKAVKKAGYENKNRIVLDAAASSFYKNRKYFFEKKELNRKELLEFYCQILKEFPILAIEDPFEQEDWEGFKEITRRFGDKIIIGDDLLTTNIKRMKIAKENEACNGVIIKPNQIGTVTEAIEAAKYAFENNWQVFVKHRGGDTLDSFIADLSVGLGTGWIMTGAPSRAERMAKYNRLLQIEEELK